MWHQVSIKDRVILTTFWGAIFSASSVWPGFTVGEYAISMFSIITAVCGYYLAGIILAYIWVDRGVSSKRAVNIWGVLMLLPPTLWSLCAVLNWTQRRFGYVSSVTFLGLWIILVIVGAFTLGKPKAGHFILSTTKVWFVRAAASLLVVVLFIGEASRFANTQELMLFVLALSSSWIFGVIVMKNCSVWILEERGGLESPIR